MVVDLKKKKKHKKKRVGDWVRVGIRLSVVKEDLASSDWMWKNIIVYLFWKFSNPFFAIIIKGKDGIFEMSKH